MTLKALKRVRTLKYSYPSGRVLCNWTGKFFDKVSTRQNVIDTGCDSNENSVFGARGNIVWYLPRTQTSLFDVRAKEGGKEYPSHGPLRFITSHSRFALGSAMQKTKHLRRRLVWYGVVFCSCVYFSNLLWIAIRYFGACLHLARSTNKLP